MWFQTKSFCCNVSRMEPFNKLTLKQFIESDAQILEECTICFETNRIINVCLNCSVSICYECKKKMNSCPVCRK